MQQGTAADNEPTTEFTFQVATVEDEYIPTGIPGRAMRAYSGRSSGGSRRRGRGCKRPCQGCGWFRQGRCQAGHKAR